MFQVLNVDSTFLEFPPTQCYSKSKRNVGGLDVDRLLQMACEEGRFPAPCLRVDLQQEAVVAHVHPAFTDLDLLPELVGTHVLPVEHQLHEMESWRVVERADATHVEGEMVP